MKIKCCFHCGAVLSFTTYDDESVDRTIIDNACECSFVDNLTRHKKISMGNIDDGLLLIWKEKELFANWLERVFVW